jgi:D-tagatose-1,6-bisphosphate aldolase subunit GatZ/KbaZ
LFRALYESPEHWRSHHPDSAGVPDWIVFFSYLDRVRYYWNQNEVNKAVDKMITNLGHDIALPLIGQYLPEQYSAVEAGSLAPAPMAIVEHKIGCALSVYADACRMSQNPK